MICMSMSKGPALSVATHRGVSLVQIAGLGPNASGMPGRSSGARRLFTPHKGDNGVKKAVMS